MKPATLLLSMTSTLLPLLTTAAPTNEITSFELRYINTLAYEHPNDTIKLIGYKKILVPDDELLDFNIHYTTNTAAWRALPNTHYDRPARTLRIYFPVKDALITHGTNTLEATSLGEIKEHVTPEQLGGDCSVLGRKQTEDVRGVVGNVVKDGVIYLSEPNKPTHRHGSVYVYDFGMKVVHDHSHGGELKTRDGIDVRAESCINNHGGPNCSNKFRIFKGRCRFNSGVCMDYNGWFTTCVNASWKSRTGVRNFPGSDCDYSMGRGHCWNEIM